MRAELSELRSNLHRDPMARLFFLLLACLVLLYVLPILSSQHLWFFAEYVVGIILSVFLLVAIRYRLTKIKSASERRFWNLIAAGMLVWLVVELVFLATPDGRWTSWMNLMVDGLYLVFYLLFFLAIITRPHVKKATEAAPSLWNLEVTATFILIYGLLTYFVIIPRGLTPAAYDTWIPSYLLYLTLDCLLFARFAYLFWECGSVRWRKLYGLFAAATALWTLVDLAEVLMFEGIFPYVESGSLLDLLWDLPHVLLVVAALAMSQADNVEDDTERDWTPEDVDLAPSAPLVAYVFALPFFHLVFSILGLLDPAADLAREICLLCFLPLLAIAAWSHQRTLVRERDAAVRDLRAAHDELELRVERRTSQLSAANMTLTEESERRRKALDSLEQQHQLLSALLANNPLAIVRLDADSRVVHCNPAFEELFQYTRSEAVGQRLHDLLVPDAERESVLEMAHRVRAGQVVRYEGQRRRKDGTLTEVEVFGVPVIVEGERVGIYMIYVDNNERNRLENQLRHSQKMEAMGRMAGGIAHDFNNLLTGIAGYARFSLDRAEGDIELRSDLIQIIEIAQAARGLTDQLLSASRMQPLSLLVSNPNKLIDKALETLRRLIPENISFEFDAQTQVSNIRVDRAQFEQVLMNLAINARDAMPNGGKLRFETRNVEVGLDFRESGRDLAPGRYVQLTCSDGGEGMEEATLQHIFEPFFSTKGAGKGSGLGLSTVYGIVQRHDGHIEVHSSRGEGTRFEVFFPAVDAEEHEPGTADRGDTELRGYETVLLVEDESRVRDVAKLVLESKRYTVLAASSPDEALAASDQHRGPIHLLVSDVVMPGMSGPELTRVLAGRRPELKVLLISGYSEDAVAAEGFSLGDAGFLQKPFSPDDLAAAVREVLDTMPPQAREQE
jgi:PAS domain S-box-containing protein